MQVLRYEVDHYEFVMNSLCVLVVFRYVVYIMNSLDHVNDKHCDEFNRPMQQWQWRGSKGGPHFSEKRGASPPLFLQIRYILPQLSTSTASV